MANKRFPSKIIPPMNQSVFKRQRLFDLLTENQHCPLAWIHGSPGMGKTTLVSSWLHQQNARFLWFRMDKGNQASADLFYFLTLGVQRNYPHNSSNLPVLTAEYADDIKAFAVVFFRQLFAVLEKETAIVLDNCQEIEHDPDFFDVLQLALNEITEGLQIICISRNRPSSLLSRLSLTGDMLAVDPASLRFNQTESTAFIHWLNPDLDTQSAMTLQERAKGWAVALVVLSQQKSINPKAQQPVVHEQQDIFNFLMTEILENMTLMDLMFLVKTAVFNQFTVSMAIRLTGYSNAQGFLDDLVKQNFLIDQSGDTETVYLYHPLLRDCLKNQLNQLLTDTQLNELYCQSINILLDREKIEDTIPLYLQLQDWDGLKSLLLKHSECLIDQGRHHAVIQWIDQLPDAMLDADPWLRYWYAVAIKPVSPLHTAELLDQCYQQFLTTEDRLGIYSSWQVAVEAIILSLDDFSQLKIWLQRFDELREHHPNCPSFELKIKFSVIALQALACSNPRHVWFNKLIKISEVGFWMISVKQLQQLICSHLGNYYALSYEITKIQLLEPYLLTAANDDSLPALPRIMNVYLIAALNVYQGNGDKTLRYLQRCLEISEQSAIRLFKPMVKLHLVGCHICRGDLDSAQQCLDNAVPDSDCKHRLIIGLFHFYNAWLCAIKSQLTLALEQNEQSLLLYRLIQYDYGIVCSLGLKARLLAETKQWELAEQALLSLANIHQRSPSKLNLLEYQLTDAWLGLCLNDRRRALAGIQRFLSVASQERIKYYLGWQPAVIAPLCVLAIEHRIETEFALSMMQLNTLCPSPPLHLEQWPWPVRIYCFDHLKIELNGQLLKQTGKSQKKVIELLYTIIALGGQNVQAEQLGDWLWPDSDGDMARQTLETAIFRLRKLIGKSAVLVKDGRISLNTDCCWTDVVAFESTLQELNHALLEDSENSVLLTLIGRLFHFYQGSFLKQIDSGAVKSKQIQLQKKLTQMIERLVAHYEKQQNRQQICWLLGQSMERIPAFESDYQTLIYSSCPEIQHPEHTLLRR